MALRMVGFIFIYFFHRYVNLKTSCLKPERFRPALIKSKRSNKMFGKNCDIYCISVKAKYLMNNIECSCLAEVKKSCVRQLIVQHYLYWQAASLLVKNLK